MRRTLVAALVAGAFLAMSIPSRAQEGGCTPPRCVRETLVYQGHEFRFNVLLPSDYDASTSTRYPVLYLFHGCGQTEDSWLDASDVVAFTADKPVIVVTPFNGFGGVGWDWQRPYETFNSQVLIPYIDGAYRTIASRAHRAIAGISGGAIAAYHFVSRHPDLFIGAAGFSGTYDFGSPALRTFWFGVAAGVDLHHEVTGNEAPLCGNDEPSGGLGPFGDPATNEVQWRNHSAMDLATNLRGMLIHLTSENGVPCDEHDVELAASGDWRNMVEPGILAETIKFDQTLTSLEIPHRTDLSPCGLHNVDFRYWNQHLQNFWDLLNGDGGFGTEPSSFDYRLADPSFSAWGWTFSADPARATEFLDVTDASAAGLTLTGSGVETVTTAGYFAPGQLVTLNGAVEDSAVADADGRITFHVDLGPAHEIQQYTIQQRALEAAGNYFVTRTVEFEV